MSDDPERRPQFRELLEPFADAALEHGLVVFAGAGLSVPRPSALPGWRALNTAFLDALCFRLARFTDGELGGPPLLEWLVERRDNHQVIPPDFQAQLAEDECGLEYFRMLQVLDIDAWNLGHWALAAMAKTGVLRALVTTNFDRLAEYALQKAEVEFRVFCAVQEFDGLAEAVNTVSDERALPIIKAHGSVEQLESMVDTLRQRVTGRPVALERAIATLVGRHVALVTGFSGADLLERPHYLGLAEGAGKSPFFVWLNLAGTTPSKAATELVAQSGSRAVLADAQLPEDLEGLRVRLARKERPPMLPWSGETEFPGIRAQTLVSDVYVNWGNRLDPISAVNILATLVEAAGATTYAPELLGKTWRHINDPHQRRDPAFLRYLRLFGRELIERALLGPSATALGGDQVKSGATAYELLAFAAADLESPDALAHTARAAYYGGAVGAALDLAALVPDHARDARPLRVVDAYVAASAVYRLAGLWDKGLPLLDAAYELAREVGDEPSRSRVSVQLARFLAALNRIDEAEAFLREADNAAERLQNVQLALDVAAARGSVEHRAKRVEQSVTHLVTAINGYAEMSMTTRCAETLLLLLYAARRSGEQELESSAIRQLDAVIPSLPALEIDYRIWYAAAYLDAEQFEKAQTALTYVRALALTMKHQHALATIGKLEAHLSK